MDLTLQTLSMVALLIYFAGLLIFSYRKERSSDMEDYFFARRSLPFWALSLTFIASWWGAGSALDTANLAFEDGLGAFWYYGVPVLLSTAILIVCSKGIRRIGYFTQGKMLESRYSKETAKVLAVMILLFMTISAASQMVGIGLFFKGYLGLGYEVSVLLGTVIVLIYSVLGGFRGVVSTDIFQFFLLGLSALIVFVCAIVNAGGFENIAIVAAESGKVDFTNFFSGAEKYLPYVITFGCAWAIQANVWQRISATRNVKDARKMSVMSFAAYIPLYLIVVFTGMAGIVLYSELPTGGIVPAIIVDFLPPLLGALVFVGISAAIMSTMDSLINTGSMTLIMDMYKTKDGSEPSLNACRIATLIVTLIALGISLSTTSFLQVTWVASDVITTGVLVPLALGFVWRRGNGKGAMASMIFGLIYCGYNLLVSLGINLYTFWEPQSVSQVLIGIGLSLLIYVSVSLATKPEYEKADKFISLLSKKSHE